jgi:hypothetical protein
MCWPIPRSEGMVAPRGCVQDLSHPAIEMLSVSVVVAGTTVVGAFWSRSVEGVWRSSRARGRSIADVWHRSSCSSIRTAVVTRPFSRGRSVRVPSSSSTVVAGTRSAHWSTGRRAISLGVSRSRFCASRSAKPAKHSPVRRRRRTRSRRYLGTRRQAHPRVTRRARNSFAQPRIGQVPRSAARQRASTLSTQVVTRPGRPWVAASQASGAYLADQGFPRRGLRFRAAACAAMSQPASELCRGSYAPAERASLSQRLDLSRKERGLCPVCGQAMTLGYALLLPAHPHRQTSG